MENNVDVNTLGMGVNTQYQNFSPTESKAGLFNLSHGAGNLKKFRLHARNMKFNIHYGGGIRRRIILPAYFSIYHMQ
jgi:hypothetical protein